MNRPCVRIVKMTFRPEEVAQFLELFEGWRHRIIAFPGCLHLQLLQGTERPNVLFTYSVWRSPDDLAAYRKSTVFGEVWPVVKQLFAAPAEAWTVEGLHDMAGKAVIGAFFALPPP